MTKSLLPPGQKIRVLTTIENGVASEMLVRESEIVASIPAFVELAAKAGLIVTKAEQIESTAAALERANEAREMLCKWSESITDKAETIVIWEIIELVSEAISSLKKINIEE